MGAGGVRPKARVNVLFVNHTGQVSGAEKSLLEVLRAMPPTILPLVACPDGPLVREIAETGVERVPLPGTDGSLKLHPRYTTVALWRIAHGAIAVRAIASRHGIAVVHANSIRAGLLTTLAARLGGPPNIVHLRDRLPPSRVSTLTLRVIAKADALVANSRYTATSLREAGVTPPARVLGNPVDLIRFDPETVDRRVARATLGLREADFVVAVLAQITPWKGQDDAIRAVAEVRLKYPNVKLLLVGSAKFVAKATRYDNLAYLDHLQRLVAELDLDEQVRFLGERDDVPTVLGATDALLVPSWEEPFGRTVIEAMAMEVPVIATDVGGPAEVVSDGEDGLLLAPRDPHAWATAISTLIESPAMRERIARNGRLRSCAFGADAHAKALVNLYQDVLDRRNGHHPQIEIMRQVEAEKVA